VTTALRLSLILGVAGGVLAPASEAQAFGRRRVTCTSTQVCTTYPYGSSTESDCRVVCTTSVVINPPIVGPTQQVLDALDAIRRAIDSDAVTPGMKQQLAGLAKAIEVSNAENKKALEAKMDELIKAIDKLAPPKK